ncbi:MAG: hypothetical protein EOP05_09810 [Proteobacteria bacterium]|nr:MAG: hypothetical protein EOP05_09810 [Pseudomonadota bacterium]
MKLLSCLLLLAFSQSALAENYTIPNSGWYSIGGHNVQCESNQSGGVSGGRGGQRRRDVYCSVYPSGGIEYVGSGSTESEALNNLQRYCISKRQSSRLQEHCSEMRNIAICQR